MRRPPVPLRLPAARGPPPRSAGRGGARPVTVPAAGAVVPATTARAARRRLLFILRKASRSRHALWRLAVAHRLGAVPARVASVFVAASATHRADPMEAYCYVIVELKASVPIWKKEVYDDGEIWKENREFDRHSGRGNGSARCCGSKVRVQEA